MPRAPASHAHSGAGRRESVRGRWARGEYDQLQPTAPGLVFPLVQLAMAQAASCGVRETQLQVRDRLTVHCTVYSVFSRSPEWCEVEPPEIATLAWRSRLSVPGCCRASRPWGPEV